MGIMYLAAGTAAHGNSTYTILILVVLVGLFYVLILRPQKSRQRKASQVQSQVMPGQRVRTTAGMYGTVVSGDDRDVVIEIAPGVHVQMLRRAVMDVVSDQDGADSPVTESEPEHVDGTPPDDWDLKDHNI